MKTIIPEKVTNTVTTKVKEIAKIANEEVTMSKKVFVLEMAAAALVGVVVGMLVSPRRNSTYNINSNNNNKKAEPETALDDFNDFWFEEDEDDFEEDDSSRSRFIKL